MKYKIPSVFDLAPDDAKPVLALIATRQVFGRTVALPAETAPAQVKSLRSAFMATMQDPEFLNEAAKLNLDINPLDGEGVGALIGKMYSSSPELVERMTKALKPSS